MGLHRTPAYRGRGRDHRSLPLRARSWCLLNLPLKIFLYFLRVGSVNTTLRGAAACYGSGWGEGLLRDPVLPWDTCPPRGPGLAYGPLKMGPGLLRERRPPQGPGLAYGPLKIGPGLLREQRPPQGPGLAYDPSCCGSLSLYGQQGPVWVAAARPCWALAAPCASLLAPLCRRAPSHGWLTLFCTCRPGRCFFVRRCWWNRWARA